MLAYILEITKHGNKGLKNRDSLKYFKLGQKYNKLGQGVQTGEKRFQIGAEITNRGKRDYILVQGFQIGSEHSAAFCSISLQLTWSYDGNQL